MLPSTIFVSESAHFGRLTKESTKKSISVVKRKKKRKKLLALQFINVLYNPNHRLSLHFHRIKYISLVPKKNYLTSLFQS